MKKLNYILVLFCFVLSLNAQQNLVPNPSFEQDTACPNNLNQIYKLNNWFTSNGSPDYFDRCYSGNFNYTWIPNNSFGYQNIQANCKSYIGLLTAWPFNNISEITTTKLTDSLIKNQKYYFSMKVNLSNTKWASNNLGAKFDCKMPAITSTATPNNQCNINFSQIITDTLNWTKLFRSFTSDSNYKYISLGNFHDSLSTSKITINPSGYIGSYYYIDDVCLSTDSAFAYNFSFNCSTVSIIENFNQNLIKIYPNPSSENYVNIDVENEHVLIFITDYTGLEKLQLNLYPGKNKVDISNYNNGMYILKIFDSYKNIIGTRKLIILKP